VRSSFRHRHASLYNVARMEPVVHRFLLTKGVAVRCRTRITDVDSAEGRVRAVLARQGEEAMRYEGDVFIDTTGTAAVRQLQQSTATAAPCASCAATPSAAG